MTGGRLIVGAIGALRMSLGVAVLISPRRTGRAFGFPDEQQTPTALLVARWFGIREVVLATLALRGHGGPAALPSGVRDPQALLRERERRFARLNAVNDAVDAAAMAIPLLARQRIDRPQLIGVPIALAVSAGWLRVLRLSRAASAASGSSAWPTSARSPRG